MHSIGPIARRSLAAQPQATRVLRVVACVAMMCVAAQVRIPIPVSEVPMTLQSLAALLCGYFLSPLAAVSAVLLYLALGAAGLPVFVGSAGLLGSTGGYLVGFVVCAGLVSLLKGGSPMSVARLTGAGLVGTISLFCCGLVGQVLFKGSFQVALHQGVAPFIGKACIQLAFAIALVRIVASRHSVRD